MKARQVDVETREGVVYLNGILVDDVMICSNVKSKLIANTVVRAGDIDVSSSQGVVTLIGRVRSEAIKSTAERLARDTKGVKDVNNELLVGRRVD